MTATEMKPKLPTLAGQRVLLNMATGRSSDYGISGRSAYGGHSGTMVSLRRAGLVALDGQLTEDGRAMAVLLAENQSDSPA